MFKNYLISAIRNVKRNPFISIISILGLSIGMAYSFLAFLYIHYEINFDTFHQKADVICRVAKQVLNANYETIYRTHCGADIGRICKKKFPEIVNYVRFTHQEGILYTHNRKYFEPHLVFFTDPSVFDVFSFPLRQGNPETALSQPGTAVITPDFAKQNFPNENPIGRKIYFQNSSMKREVELVITGILYQIPPNSHLQFGLLASFSTLLSVYSSGYLDNDFDAYTYTYFEISSPAAFNILQKKLDSHYFPEFQNDRMIKKVMIEKLKDIYFSSLAPPGKGEKTGNSRHIMFFILSFIFILFISCLNVINLFTARTSSRGREATIRKITGATREEIIYQFIIEALVLSFISLIGALILTEISLRFFNWMIQREIIIDYFRNPEYIGFALFITLLTGILSGLYPALFFSATQPTALWKGRRNLFAKKTRKIIVIIQFIISISLFICSAVADQESLFLLTKDPGFKRDNILIVNMNTPHTKGNYSLFKNNLLAEKTIVSVGGSSSIPWNTSQVQKIDIGSSDFEGLTSAYVIYIDKDFLKTYSINILEGEDFSDKNANKIIGTFIINETAKKNFGWDRAPGKRLYIAQMSFDSGIRFGTVKGLINDFNFMHPINKIQPLILVYFRQKERQEWDFVSIRFKENMREESIALVKEIWEKTFPLAPFSASSLNTIMEEKHSSLFDVINTALKLSTAFAVFIACLGLLGLTFYESEQRTREIGIRKALGAASFEITLSLMKNIVILLSIANIIAWPLSIAIINGLFSFFHYPFPFKFRPIIFFLSSAGSFILALITVSGLTFRSSKANPTDSLRYE
ncbi:MAG: ABC transporter permease [Spirochaetales bacterium]|nr:ABC transporter permease [Spirochaetales bacterium]